MPQRQMSMHGGWASHRRFWGQGYATEIGRAGLTFERQARPPHDEATAAGRPSSRGGFLKRLEQRSGFSAIVALATFAEGATVPDWFATLAGWMFLVIGGLGLWRGARLLFRGGPDIRDTTGARPVPGTADA